MDSTMPRTAAPGRADPRSSAHKLRHAPRRRRGKLRVRVRVRVRVRHVPRRRRGKLRGRISHWLRLQVRVCTFVPSEW